MVVLRGRKKTSRIEILLLEFLSIALFASARSSKLQDALVSDDLHVIAFHRTSHRPRELKPCCLRIPKSMKAIRRSNEQVPLSTGHENPFD